MIEQAPTPATLVAGKAKRLGVTLIRAAVTAGILSYLAMHLRGSSALSTVVWSAETFAWLGVAGLLLVAALFGTIVRWHGLVRAADLTLSFAEAFRLCAAAYFFSFISLGGAAGDVWRIVYVSRGRRADAPRAVASIVIDRILGLYTLLLVASLAVVSARSWAGPVAELRILSQAILVVFAAATCGLLTIWRISNRASEVLRFRPERSLAAVVIRFVEAFTVFRRHGGTVATAMAVSCCCHTAVITAIFLVARSFDAPCPTFGQHVLIVPTAAVAGSLPLPLNGLGALEATLDFLYVGLGPRGAIAPGHGFLVGLTYRAITMMIAAAAGIFWAVSGRRRSANQMCEANAATRNADALTTPREGAERQAA